MCAGGRVDFLVQGLPNASVCMRMCQCGRVVVWCCGGVALFMVFKIERNLLLTP